MGRLFTRIERRSGNPFGMPPVLPWSAVSDGTPGSTGNGSSAPDSALQVPTVWACVSLLANAVSMMSLEAYRRNAAGVPTAVEAQLLTAPSDSVTQSEWLHMVMASLLLRGNAFGRITERDDQARPLQINLLAPDSVRVSVDPNGRVRYWTGPAGTVDVTDDIWHVRGLRLPGSVVGLSPIAYAAATIGIDLASRKFASDFYAGGGIPKAVIKSDRDIDHDLARGIKARVLEATQNREPLTLGQGLDYVPISVKPEESQFLATQQANVSQIARYFGVPPEMVGGSSGSSLTYANVEQRQLDFLTLGVSRWLKCLEDAISPLLPPPVFARFNTSVLLRTDARTQAEVDNMQLAGKTRVPSELRARDGLPPMTAAQQTEADMVPLTITPMGGAKALPALKANPGATAPVPASEGAANA